MQQKLFGELEHKLDSSIDFHCIEVLNKILILFFHKSAGHFFNWTPFLRLSRTAYLHCVFPHVQTGVNLVQWVMNIFHIGNVDVSDEMPVFTLNPIFPHLMHT